MTSAHASHIKRILIATGFALLLLIPIIVFCLPILLSGFSLSSGDFDMQVQMTEAARVSIVNYGQFPFWNPWVSGGVPLFADPQFGLFTPQTLFAFFTNSVFAWKLTFLLYLCVGFFSMKTLLKGVGLKNTALQILLSYIYIFNSFFILRFNGGHFTFLLLLLLPLVVHLALTYRARFRLVQLSLLITYLLYAAAHYSTVLILLFVAILVTLLAVKPLLTLLNKHKVSKTLWRELIRDLAFGRLIFLAKAVGIALVLASPRLWLTINYLHGNGPDRTRSYENFFGIIDGFKALFMPFGSYATPHATYGPFEASNYIGSLTGLILLAYLATYTLRYFRVFKLSRLVIKPRHRGLLIAVALMGIGCFILGLGGIAFYAMQHLPVFSSMRVSTRYFTIFAFCIILTLGIFAAQRTSRRMQLVVVAFVFVALIQVFAANAKQVAIEWTHNKNLDTVSFAHQPDHSTTTPPKFKRLWNANSKIGDYHLSAAMQTGRAQIITDNALLETRAIGSHLCDEDSPNCTFVLSSNAQVMYWSPSHIRIQRTQPGDITLNINPGAGWRVNNQAIFKNEDIVSNSSTFTIPSSASGIVDLTYNPF